MSNNIYDILSKLNAIEQTPRPKTEQPKAKTQLAENIANIESQLNEKYMGFKKTVAAIKKGGSAENPEAVAAEIGRDKYGKEKFQQAAARGKKLGEDEHDVREDLKEMDKSQPSSDRGGESSGNPYAMGGKAKPVKPKVAAKDAEEILNTSMKRARKKDVAKGQAPTYNVVNVQTGKSVGTFRDGAGFMPGPNAKAMGLKPGPTVPNGHKVDYKSIVSEQGVAEGKYDPAKDTFSPETHTAITKDGVDKVIPIAQLAKYKKKGWKERHSLKAFHKNREEQGVAEDSWINGKKQSNDTLTWKQTSLSLDAAKKKYGDSNAKIEGKNRLGEPIVVVRTGGVKEGSDYDNANAGLQRTVDFAKQHGYKVYRSKAGKTMKFVNNELNHELWARVDNDPHTGSINVNFADYTSGISGNDDASYFDETFKDAYEEVLADHRRQVLDLNEQGVAEEGVRRHKGTYGTSYDPDAPEKAAPAVKRSQRGRPRKDADVTGHVPQWDTDTLSRWIVGSTPKKLPGKASVTHKIKAESQQDVAEVAPPGAEAERMVKHIKKGYAKDGKLTAREKGIAYATAWKAHKAGRVEEAVDALRVLADRGMTAEQITEGWQDMMEAVKATHDSEKTTGKFNKERDTVTGGTRYTRKYNPKTGETDDTENVTAVKRGPGRPKKHAFEQFAEVYESILEQPQSVSGRVTPLPPTLQKPTSGATKTAPAMGTIDKYGMWSSKPPRPGEKGVALPSPQEQPQEESVGDTDMQEMMRLAGMEDTLKGGQKKLDRNNNGRLDATDFAILRGEQDKVDEVSRGEYIKQQDTAAEKAGKKSFSAFGQEFSTDQVEESKEMYTECGMPSMDSGQEQQGHMSISMNVSSDGTQSLNVNAQGEDAAKLAQLLKLAGLGASHEQPVYQPVQVTLGAEQPEEFEEAKDERYHASTTPDEEVYSVDRLIKGGNGDVAGQEKTMRKHGYQFGDNPIAMKETVARDYESIKVKK